MRKPPPPSTPAIQRQTYTVEEAAQVLGVGRNKMLELVHTGAVSKLSGLGRRILISAAALDAYMLG